MKRIFGIVIALLSIYIFVQMIYSFISGSRTSTYSLSVGDISYQVKEKYTTRHRTSGNEVDDKNSYYYEVTANDNITFSFKIVGNYTGVEHFLTQIKTYKRDNLNCIYPVFKEKNNDLDVMCHDNSNKFYLYGTVRKQNPGLDVFINYLKDLGYYYPDWEDPNLTTKNVNNFVVYPNSISKDRIFTIWQYRGFYRIANGNEKYYGFDMNDQYEPDLVTLVNQYYIVPEYKEGYSFKRVFMTNLISGTMETIDLGASIPYDSFVQGVVDGIIYLIDRSNKVQYTIDIYNKKTKIIGNSDVGTKYYINHNWENRSIYDVLDNNLMFKNDVVLPVELQAYSPMYVGEIGGETDGYYYLYLKENSLISVYRADKQNTSNLTRVFTVPSINNMKYISNDLYFISDDTLYVYRNELGLRPLVKYSEFLFNKSNLYNAYIKN